MIKWIQGFFSKKKDRNKIIEDKYKKIFSKTHSQTAEFLKIGEFQLLNLFSNPIKFTLLDLRSSNQKPHFARSLLAHEGNAYEILLGSGAQSGDAVVIVCETGEISEKVACKLAGKSFTNIVVLESGTRSLSEKAHNIQDMYYLLHKKP